LLILADVRLKSLPVLNRVVAKDGEVHVADMGIPQNDVLMTSSSGASSDEPHYNDQTNTSRRGPCDLLGDHTLIS
jgi:hypothetical protein